MKHIFNEKVLELREHKLHLVDRMNTIGDRLAEIRLEIPPNLAEQPPLLPVIDEDLEFPEKNLEVSNIRLLNKNEVCLLNGVDDIPTKA